MRINRGRHPYKNTNPDNAVIGTREINTHEIHSLRAKYCYAFKLSDIFLLKVCFDKYKKIFQYRITRPA